MCIFVKSDFLCHQGTAPAPRWCHQGGCISRNVHKVNIYKCTNFHACNKKCSGCRINDWTIMSSGNGIPPITPLGHQRVKAISTLPIPITARGIISFIVPFPARRAGVELLFFASITCLFIHMFIRSFVHSFDTLWFPDSHS